jgi:hypothetical protein
LRNSNLGYASESRERKFGELGQEPEDISERRIWESTVRIAEVLVFENQEAKRRKR